MYLYLNKSEQEQIKDSPSEHQARCFFSHSNSKNYNRG